MIQQQNVQEEAGGRGGGGSLLWAGQGRPGISWSMNWARTIPQGREEREHVTEGMEKQNETSLEEARQAVY